MQTNTMAYGWDNFSFQKRALLRSNACWDCTAETSVTGFEISGCEDEGTKRRIIFKLEDDKLYKFGDNGTLIEYESRDDLETILEEGNTVGELLALNNVNDFIGHRVYPIIALWAAPDAPVAPKISMKLKVSCYNDRYIRTLDSPVYSLKNTADSSKINEIKASTYSNGHGKIVLYARIFEPVTGWSDWGFLPDFNNKFATKIQFREKDTLTTLDGSDFAACNYIQCLYSTDGDILSGSTEEIISLAQDYPEDLKTAYLLVKHSEIVDAEIKAYVNFSAAPARRENVLLGTATGEEQTLSLAYNAVVDKNVVGNSIHLEVGGKTFTGFYFDTENSTITIKADEGQEIYGSWDCGLDSENWREMTLDYTQAQDNYFASRFIYRIADETNKKVAAIKIVLTRLSGNVDTTEIGTGTGELQIFAIPHKAKLETLSASGAWKYDEEGQILKTVANIDMEMTAGYSWQGNLSTVYSYIAGFSVS